MPELNKQEYQAGVLELTASLVETQNRGHQTDRHQIHSGVYRVALQLKLPSLQWTTNEESKTKYYLEHKADG